VGRNRFTSKIGPSLTKPGCDAIEILARALMRR